MNRGAGVVAALLAASNVGACGTTGNERAVRDAVNGWVTAVTRHDGPRACARLSSELRRHIERHLLGEGTEGNCNTWAARWVSPRHPASHRDARITAVQVHGEHATVRMTARDAPPGWVTLVREDGRWRIDNF